MTSKAPKLHVHVLESDVAIPDPFGKNPAPMKRITAPAGSSIPVVLDARGVWVLYLDAEGAERERLFLPYTKVTLRATSA
jgi:hypothetical protein